MTDMNAPCMPALLYQACCLNTYVTCDMHHVIYTLMVQACSMSVTVLYARKVCDMHVTCTTFPVGKLNRQSNYTNVFVCVYVHIHTWLRERMSKQI